MKVNVTPAGILAGVALMGMLWGLLDYTFAPKTEVQAIQYSEAANQGSISKLTDAMSSEQSQLSSIQATLATLNQKLSDLKSEVRGGRR